MMSDSIAKLSPSVRGKLAMGEKVFLNDLNVRHVLGRAGMILGKNWSVVDKLANALIEELTVDGDDLQDILAGVKPDSEYVPLYESPVKKLGREIAKLRADHDQHQKQFAKPKPKKTASRFRGKMALNAIQGMPIGHAHPDLMFERLGMAPEAIEKMNASRDWCKRNIDECRAEEGKPPLFNSLLASSKTVSPEKARRRAESKRRWQVFQATQ